ncbi:MAG: gamma-butyrobetaine hydroxylase-like domain-containing protein [Hyphomicrobium sp.]
MEAPAAIEVSADLRTLEITTGSGDQVRLAAERLRISCKCAHCLRARIDDRFPSAFPGLAIVDVARVGSYAVNLAFSDGHNRGIYPWPFLYGLVDASA